MSEQSLTPKHLAGIPLFPLPRMVFFPHTTIPLHVFEPRYVALIEHCLENEWPVALPMIKPGQEDDHLGNPAVVEVCGVGTITHSQNMRDGRIGVIVQGIARVRIDSEIDLPQPFRVARVTPIEDEPVSPAVAAENLHTLRECLTLLGRRVPKLSEALLSATSAEKDPAVITNRLAPLIFRSDVQRQELLETTDVGVRLAKVVSRLSALAAGTAVAKEGMAN